MTGRRFALPVIVAAGISVAAAQTNPPELQWHDARKLGVEGQGWSDAESAYDRFPARAEKTLPPAVWSIGRNSAGLCVHFVTDAPAISVRWTVRNEGLAMPHMPATGVSGVDLYVKEQGTWRWLGTGQPDKFPTNERMLASSLPRQTREHLLYLPLYNRTAALQIGVAADAKVASAARTNTPPIVFYGTSIVQGACASRPGMAYPAILGRRLDRPVLNFGFSGSAHCEPELAAMLAELDPAAYVLDPLPNMDAGEVAARLEPFIQTLRRAHPRTPIVLVENLEYPDGEVIQARGDRHASASAGLRKVHQRLTDAGDRKLFRVAAKGLIGADGEATVDGTHPTDLGQMRIADHMEPTLRRALKAR